MRIFLIGSNIPFRRHDQPGVTAVHVVLYELIRGLSGLGHGVVFQVLFNQHRSAGSLSPAEEGELQHVREIGIKVLPRIHSAQYVVPGTPSFRFGSVARLIASQLGAVRIDDFYPAINAREVVCERIYSNKADAVLTVWSPEGVAATHGLSDVPRISYQGDIDFRPAEARFQDCELFDGAEGQPPQGSLKHTLQRLRQWLWLSRFRRAHLRLMHEVRVIANVTAANAEYYSRQRHPRSIYVRNTWSDQALEGIDASKRPLPEAESRRPVKIIGHVGYLNRTGSTYGLKFLLVDLAPRLNQVMGGLEYEIHIIGGGEAVPALRPWLAQEHVIQRGFVEDLDAELISGDVFLLLNNAGSYHAAYTRHLVAWSLGLCLIVHENSRRTIPEIVHMENALVGGTPAEVAEMVFLAATDPELNQRIRKGGRATYKQYFTPLEVAKTLSDELVRARNA